MKRSLFAVALLVAAPLAQAGPYVGAGYQYSDLSVEEKDLQNPVVDGRPIDLSRGESDSNFRLLAGYAFDDRWALELTYHDFELSEGEELRLSATEEEEWDASIDGRHITLGPVYRHALSDQFDLRATVGVVYGDYDLEQSHVIDIENGPDQTVSRATASESKFGGMAGVGAVFHAPWNIDVIAEYQYTQTSIVSKSAFALSAAYRF